MTSRDQYVEKLKAELDRWNAQAGAWEEKARTASAELRAQYERQLESLRANREQASQRLREVQAASAAAWQDLARGADQAWRDLRESFDRARGQFEPPESTPREAPVGASNARDRYREELRAQILEWQADAQRLRALSDKASADAQAAMKPHIEELDARIAAAAEKLLELSNISEEAFESMRASFESAWDGLRSAVREAAAKLKG